MDNQEYAQGDELVAVLSETEIPAVKSQSRTSLIAWIIFATGILYYCFAYLLRVYPSVMEHDLRSYFNITAGGFGLLTSFYYFAYAPMQLPIGVLLDRIGPRRSLIFASIISTAGAFVFAYVHVFHVAIVGRFMIGIGAGFAYVTALKLASTWLPRKYFATATGLVTGCGMVSAIFTDMYLTHSVNVDGFRHAIYFPIFVGLAMIVLIFLIIRNKPANQKSNDAESTFSSALSYKRLGEYLLKIIRNPQMWLIGIVGSLMYLPSSVFLDVWAIPYLKTVHGLSAEQAALGVSIMLTGWIVSSFGSGALSDIFGTRKAPILIASVLASVVACVLLYTHGLPVYMIYTLLFLFGICCGPHPLCFTLSKENNPHEISGTTVAFANFLIMMGGFIFQPVVGNILDFLWDGSMDQGIRIYSAQNYTTALSLIPIGLFLSIILTLFIKETYHRAIAEERRIAQAAEESTETA
jgi:sugar phosphate permease